MQLFLLTYVSILFGFFISPIKNFSLPYPAVLGSTASLYCKKPISQGLNQFWARKTSSDPLVLSRNGQLEPSTDRRKFATRLYGTNVFLDILQVSLVDEGEYICYYQNQVQDGEYFRLIVLVWPSLFVVENTATLVNEGDAAKLKCRVSGAKPLPEIKWTIKAADDSVITVPDDVWSVSNFDRQFTNGTGSRESTLDIINATRQLYRSTFHCRAIVQNLYEDERKLAFSMKVSPMQPYMTGLSADIGMPLTVTCHVYGANPKADIIILEDDIRLSGVRIGFVKSGDGTTNTTGTVTIATAARMTDDGRQLECRATNGILAPKSIVQLVAINRAPSYAIVSSDSTTAVEGEKFSIYCSSDANPAPLSTEVVWYKNEATIDVTESIRYVTTVNDSVPTLTIKPVERTDAGMYQCQVENRLGVAQSLRYKVETLYRPVCEPYQQLKYACRQGEAVPIACHVIANPSDVTFNWTQSDGALSSYDKISGDVLSTNIVVSKVDVSVRAIYDYRLYECKARNVIGEMISSCNIAVVQPGKADAPVNCQTFNITEKSLDVVCHPVFDGGSKPNYVIKIKPAKNNEANYVTKSNRSLPVFAVTGLSPETEYHFQVCASNAEFWNQIDCTRELVFKTLESNVTLAVAGLVSPEMLPLVIVGTVIGVLFIIFVVAVLLTTKGQCHQKCRNSQPELDKSSTSVEMEDPEPPKTNLKPNIINCYEDSIHSESRKNRVKKVTRFSDHDLNPAQIWLGPDERSLDEEVLAAVEVSQTPDDNSDPDTIDTFIVDEETPQPIPGTVAEEAEAPNDDRRKRPLSRGSKIDETDEPEQEKPARKASKDVTAVIEQLRAESATRRASLDQPVPPPLPPRAPTKPTAAKRAPIVRNDNDENPPPPSVNRFRPALSFLEAVGESSSSSSSTRSSSSSSEGEEFIDVSMSPDDVGVDRNSNDSGAVDGQQTTDGDNRSSVSNSDDDDQSAEFTIRDDFVMEV